jgi:translation initiation factor 3 subunit B
MKTLNGQLLFFNADDFEILGEDEHFMCTDIVWDPTGRYVTSRVLI